MASRSPPQSSSAPSSRRFLAAMSSPRLSPAQARPPPSPSPSWRSSIKNRECQALVLAPTRELANQIYKCITALSDFITSKRTAAWEAPPFAKISSHPARRAAGRERHSRPCHDQSPCPPNRLVQHVHARRSRRDA